MTTKISFSDGEHVSQTISSSWRGKAKSAEFQCQTEPDLYEFGETEVQSGIETSVVQVEVSSKLSGMGLCDMLTKLKKAVPQPEWANRITSGKVTVDGEVITDPAFKVEEDFFIEYVDYKKDASVRG
jgi:hypothetical protein